MMERSKRLAENEGQNMIDVSFIQKQDDKNSKFRV